MLINNFRTDDRGVTADIHVERTHSTHHISIHADGGSLTGDPNAFLLGAFLPALAGGESRIRIDGPVCPTLAANLQIAASLVKQWAPEYGAAPVLECDYAYRPSGHEVGAFVSGGVDSLAMLRRLTSSRPVGHPDRPTAAIVADIPGLGGLPVTETDARIAHSAGICSDVCADLGLRVITVRSTFCTLNPTMPFWMYRYHGAFLASIAHALRDFRAVHIASTYPVTHLAPWGSHPLLDPFYSSHHTRIVHSDIELSRLEKVRTIADWPLALNRVYVCTSRTSNGRNCGRCEKCLRTKLHLLVCGVLETADAFSESDVTAEQIRTVDLGSAYARLCYAETLPHLERMGRADLVAAVHSILDIYDHNGIIDRAGRKLRKGVAKMQRYALAWRPAH